jgi:hypothetical protein
MNALVSVLTLQLGAPLRRVAGRYWPVADICDQRRDVRSWGRSRHTKLGRRCCLLTPSVHFGLKWCDQMGTSVVNLIAGRHDSASLRSAMTRAYNSKYPAACDSLEMPAID